MYDLQGVHLVRRRSRDQTSAPSLMPLPRIERRLCLLELRSAFSQQSQTAPPGASSRDCKAILLLQLQDIRCVSRNILPIIAVTSSLHNTHQKACGSEDLTQTAQISSFFTKQNRRIAQEEGGSKGRSVAVQSGHMRQFVVKALFRLHPN